jgi:hypothetical protein
VDAEVAAMMRWIRAVCIALLFCATTAYAHVGSNDVYADGQAGPYKLSIVIRPPLVIPGVAEIEVRGETPGIERITITPVPLVGAASKYPPVPDTMQKPSKDPQFYTGHLWIMAPGSWQVRFSVSGGKGPGTLSIPLPATALGTRKMQPALGGFLAAMGIFLILGLAGIVGAAVREAMLRPGVAVPTGNLRRGHVAMTVAFVLLVTLVIFGSRWWKADAATYAGRIYKPLEMHPALEDGNLLDLKLADPGWLPQRQLDDFISDHDHLMHLYMIRWPEMDVVFHLHPEPVGPGEFQLALPSMPEGDYHLYADVVHANGFPETLVAAIILPKISGKPLGGDDAEGIAKSVSITNGAEPIPAKTMHEQKFSLPDGYTMIWKMPEALVAKVPEDFRFELLDPQGEPPSDMTLYMGMLGHAAFVNLDGTVFAHIHPMGTVSMAAFDMANPHASIDNRPMNTPNMDGMQMGHSALPNVVSFPYGFPAAGQYRIIVQMKHGNIVETGIFDADVRASAR